MLNVDFSILIRFHNEDVGCPIPVILLGVLNKLTRKIKLTHKKPQNIGHFVCIT